MANKRHDAILRIIKQKPILTQEDLQNELISEGFDVTQSTVSRDIKKLRIVKALDNLGNYRYTNEHNEKQVSKSSVDMCHDSFARAAVSIDYSFNNVVIKCFAGMASSACVAIDTLFSDCLVGSLAGDDTVIVVTKGEEESIYLTSKLKELL